MNLFFIVLKRMSFVCNFSPYGTRALFIFFQMRSEDDLVYIMQICFLRYLFLNSYQIICTIDSVV